MDIVDLPRDLFLLIVAHLSARKAVACRRVSRRWNGAFADEDLGLRLLRWHFPRCRELRLALAAAAAAEASSPDGGVATTGHGDSPGHGAAEGQRARGGAAPNSSGAGGARRSSSRTCWAAVFARVARRYHHLRAAAPRSVEKIRHGAMATAEEGDGGAWPGTPPPGFLPVRPWDRHLRLHDKTAPFHYPDPGWCYGQDDGLLVYHASREEDNDDDDEGKGAARPCCPLPWRWLDLETRRGGTVPFARREGDAVVRRVRLADGVLVVEWCAPRAGRHPDHQACEDGDEEWPHFVTVYDVRRVAPATTDNDNDDSNDSSEIEQGGPESGSSTWIFTQRTEFPLLPGWPINKHSRFFSTHTNTHYAVYIWQGDRMSRDNHPVDVVVIRDISTTPPGRQQQQEEEEEPPPRVVRTMSWDTLDFYGVRQRSAPRLRCLGMDDRNLYLTEEEHRWARGAHSSPSPPRVHLVRTTGIPIIPAAAAAAAAAATPSSLDGQEVEREGEEEGEKSRQVVVQGPRWVDECGANGDVNMSFCSRAAGASHAHGAPPTTTTRSQQHTSHPAAAGGGVGAGRWPGWAPCWRHEEFPYLTVSEMVDLRAGVRVTARHCFMLETLSVHVRPSLSVRGLGGAGGDGRDDGDGGGGGSKGGRTSGPRSTRSEGGGGAGTRARPRKGTRGDEDKRSDDDGGGGGDSDEEVQFADEMWDALLGKGFICGDERWLIGEDRQGAITILRF